MPLHRIYTAKGVFSAEDKQAISERITKIYSILPKFYVVVVFLEVEPESFYIGGQPNARFVRVVSQHLARTQLEGRPEDVVVRAGLRGVPRVSAGVAAPCTQPPCLRPQCSPGGWCCMLVGAASVL